MRDLVRLLDQIKLCDDSWVVLESILPNSKELFNGVLDASLDLTFMQDSSESLKDSVNTRRSGLREHLATFNHKIGCHLDRVLSSVL